MSAYPSCQYQHAVSSHSFQSVLFGFHGNCQTHRANGLQAILTFSLHAPHTCTRPHSLLPSFCWCHRDSRLLTFSLPFLLFPSPQPRFKVHSIVYFLPGNCGHFRMPFFVLALFPGKSASPPPPPPPSRASLGGGFCGALK